MGGLSFLSFTEDVGMGASAVKGNDTDFGILLVKLSQFQVFAEWAGRFHDKLCHKLRVPRTML